MLASTDVIVGYLKSLLRAARYVKVLHDRLATARLKANAAEKSLEAGRAAPSKKMSLMRSAAATRRDVTSAKAVEQALEQALVQASERFQNEAPNFQKEFDKRWEKLRAHFEPELTEDAPTPASGHPQ